MSRESAETIIHKAMRDLIRRSYEEYGIKIDTIFTDWREYDSGRKVELINIQMTTTTRIFDE